MSKQAKQMAFELESRAHLSAGVQKVARAVKTTLGPSGHCAIIDRGWGEPVVTKDGASVAEAVELSDPYENMAARLVREAAEKTSNQAGDGSTTTTVLAESIFTEGLKHVTAGQSAMLIARGVREAAEQAVEELSELSTRVRASDQAQITSVATVAANGDKLIGKTISSALTEVGKDGVITIEEGKSVDTEVNVVEGMDFDRGYLSPHFVTDTENMRCELEKPYILVMEEKVSTLPKILPLLEKVHQKKGSLLIIAEDVEGEVLATLVVNTMKGVLSCAAVKAPGYGDRRKAMLGDIATVTSATPIMKDVGITPEKIELRMLGRAKKVVITSENTTIVEGEGKAKALKAREAEIRNELENTTSDYDREKLEERLAKLVGGVAVISVGAATESEMKEIKSRYESALSATRAALEEGVVAGGGVAFMRLADRLTKSKSKIVDTKMGFEILRSALLSPIRQLTLNAGAEPAEVLRMIRGKKARTGYDLSRGEVCDMIEAGIIDPAKVTRVSLQNAVSVATVLLTSDALVANIPQEEEEDEDHHHHHDHDMGGMGGMPGMGGMGGMGGMPGMGGMGGMGGMPGMGGMGGMPGMDMGGMGM